MFCIRWAPLSETDDVLFDIIIGSNEFASADGVVFTDYEEVDDMTPENYRSCIRMLNVRNFSRTEP